MKPKSESDTTHKALTAVILLFFIIILGAAIAVAVLSRGNDAQSKNPADNVSSLASNATESEGPAGNNTTSNEDDSEIEAVTPEEAYEHARVVSTIDAPTSSSAVNESQAAAFLAERGFQDIAITSCYGADGAYAGESEIDASATSTHPTYEANYITESGESWVLYLYNGQIMANPLSYNFEIRGDDEPMAILSEKAEITSYDSATKSFYVIVPDGTELQVKTVERIDAKTLDELSAEKVGAL